MKLTKEKLRQIIKEELDMFDEPEPPENLEADELQDRLWSEIREAIVSWLANSYQKQGMRGAFETADRDAKDLYREIQSFGNIESVIHDWAMAYVRSDDNTLEEG
jgi:hypothetical protein